MSEPRCRTCERYQPPEAEGPGECRRRSPKAVQDYRTGAVRSSWPKVWGDRDWCGEWREAEPHLLEETSDERS